MKELFQTAPASDGSLKVSLSTGGDSSVSLQGLGWVRRIDEEEAARDDKDESGELLEFVNSCWPDVYDNKIQKRLDNGTTFCDMMEVLRDSEIALAVLEYGRLHRWWSLMYDPNQRCLNCAGSEEVHVGCHCVIRIENFRRPPRRTKRKREREPLASRFRDFLFPERGIAIA